MRQKFKPLQPDNGARSIRALFHSNAAKKEFRALRDQVESRDGVGCIYCTVTSSFGLEFDQKSDHSKLVFEDVQLACPICHSLQHLELAGDSRLFAVTYAPEFTQAEIIQVFYAVVVMREMFKLANQKRDSINPELHTRLGRINSECDSIWARLTQGRIGEHIVKPLSRPEQAGFNMLEKHGFKYEAATLANINLRFNAETISNLFIRFKADRPDLYETRWERLGGLRLIPVIQQQDNDPTWFEVDSDAYRALLPVLIEQIKAEKGLDSLLSNLLPASISDGKLTPEQRAAAEKLISEGNAYASKTIRTHVGNMSLKMRS